VIDGLVTGNGKLNFEGKAGGKRVSVNLDYKITSGAGMNLPCAFLPPLCDASDLIPFIYFGDGKTSIHIGSSQSNVNVLVAVDALNRPRIAGGIINIIALDSKGLPVLDFTTGVSSYNVHYMGTIVPADVSGDLAGRAIVVVESTEDHTAHPTGISSIDKRKIEFNVDYKGKQINMKGSFDGKSTG